MATRITMDEGEEAPVRFTLLEADAVWADLADATITLRLRSVLAPTGPLFTSTAVTLDAPVGGQVRGGTILAPADAPPGLYSAEVEIRKPTRSLPKIEQLEILVRARPAKPAA